MATEAEIARARAACDKAAQVVRDAGLKAFVFVFHDGYSSIAMSAKNDVEFDIALKAARLSIDHMMASRGIELAPGDHATPIIMRDDALL